MIMACTSVKIQDQTMQKQCKSDISAEHYRIWKWYKIKQKLNSVALVRKQTIPTERPRVIGEVSANYCG
jgi:hypothetical protein